LIDEIVRAGARRMLAEALQAEVDDYIARFVGERDEHGRRLVVRNGSHQPREVLTSAGAVEVVAPRVDDRRVDPETGQRRRFSSAVPPPWCRKTPKMTEVLPLLYLHGLSSGDFVPALGEFLGSTTGLSGPVITKLTEIWKSEQRAFAARDLSSVDYVYLWADGIHVNIRLEEHKLCLLVLIGVRADGRKELVALADGYRESGESWADLLRYAARRGMRAPVLAVGDGALGFWAALREVFPVTREQRCWFHKIGNVLAALPRSAHPGAKKALAQIWNAEDRQHAPRRRPGVRDRLRSQVRRGHREDHRRSRRAARVLRLPRRALDPPAHHEPDRVDLRHRPTPHQDHPRPRAPARPAWRWRSSSSKPPRTAGARSTHPTSSRSSASATFQGGKLVERTDEHPKPKPPNRSSSTGLDDCSVHVGCSRRPPPPSGRPCSAAGRTSRSALESWTSPCRGDPGGPVRECLSRPADRCGPPAPSWTLSTKAPAAPNGYVPGCDGRCRKWATCASSVEVRCGSRH
jgi:transposase-like protein